MNTLPTIPETGPYALRARYVFTVAGPPVEDGVVTIDGGRIVAVGENVSGRAAIDLGNVALLPGLVNAHTHLDFSLLDAPLGEAGMVFPHWIKHVTAWRRLQPADNAAAVQAGWTESLRCGVTTLGDIGAGGVWTPELRPPQDVTVFHETIAVTADRAPAAGLAAEAFLDTCATHTHWRPGLSPHAPYTVLPEVFERLVALAAERQVPVAFHLAESREELEYLRAGAGAFRQLFVDMGIEPKRGAIPLGTRPLDYLRTLARAPRALVVHGNYLDDEEIAFLAEQRDRMTVVYCPRTHAYFAHARHPLPKLLTAGVPVALGTDGRCSNPDLDLLAELRYVAHHFPELPQPAVLRLGTLAGARALGLAHEVGSLAAGKRADLAIIPLPSATTTDPYELLFDSALPVVATICRGQLVYRNDTLNESPAS